MAYFYLQGAKGFKLPEGWADKRFATRDITAYFLRSHGFYMDSLYSSLYQRLNYQAPTEYVKIRFSLDN